MMFKIISEKVGIYAPWFLSRSGSFPGRLRVPPLSGPESGFLVVVALKRLQPLEKRTLALNPTIANRSAHNGRTRITCFLRVDHTMDS